MNRIIFVLELISQPRCLKRIESIKSHENEVIVWGFDNNLYNENLIDCSFKINRFEYKYSKTNKLHSFIKRWICIVKLIKSSNKTDIFYLFVFNIALLAKLSFLRNRYLYEESDITYTKRNTLLFIICKFIDKKIREKSLLTVFTIVVKEVLWVPDSLPRPSSTGPTAR